MNFGSGVELDVLLAGISYYSRLSNQFDTLESDVKYALVYQFTELLETFLLTVQQSITDRLDWLGGANKKLNKLDICSIIDKIFFTEEGKA